MSLKRRLRSSVKYIILALVVISIGFNIMLFRAVNNMTRNLDFYVDVMLEEVEHQNASGRGRL